MRSVMSRTWFAGKTLREKSILKHARPAKAGHCRPAGTSELKS